MAQTRTMDRSTDRERYLHDRIIRMPDDLGSKPLFDALKRDGGHLDFHTAVNAVVNEFGVVVEQLRNTDSNLRKMGLERDQAIQDYRADGMRLTNDIKEEKQRGISAVNEEKRRASNAINAIQAELESVTSKLQSLGRKYEQLEIEKATDASNHDSIIEDHQAHFKKHHNDLVDDFKRRIHELKEQHQGDIDGLMLAHSEALGKQEGEIRRLNDVIAQMAQDHDSEVANLKSDHKVQVSKMEKDFEAEREDLKRLAVEQQKGLRDDVAALNRALVNRGDDDFKSMTDSLVKTRFEDLANDIDFLSRRDWKFNRTPWPDDVLKSTKNPRRARNFILKQAMWMALFEFVFNSPFRMFGKIGLDLEKFWATEIGQGSFSPLAEKQCS
jgi:hypothetical protein